MFCCISLHFIKDDFLHSGADIDLSPCNVFRLQTLNLDISMKIYALYMILPSVARANDELNS